MILPILTKTGSYDVVIRPGCLRQAASLLRLDRRVLIVTDSGVPAVYAKTLAAQCARPVIVTVPQGEGSKSLERFGALLRTMLQNGFTRGDCVCAVGGGVVGDLAGFAASAYMRGVDFYNLPTTVLSMVDSSVGGKTAVNLGEVKNVAGAFYPPKGVLIDTDTLATLPPRQITNGLAEAVKMAMTSDEALFAAFEGELPPLQTVVARALAIKKAVVEADETEQGLRRILNFGHTLGHGIESQQSVNGLYHGECVALGMLPMCSDAARARLVPVLERLGLPTEVKLDADAAFAAVCHDKKADSRGVTTVWVDRIGSCELRSLQPEALRRLLDWYGRDPQ